MDLCRVPSTSNLNLSMVSSLFLGSFQSLPIALTSNAVANLRTVHLLKVSSGVAVPSDWRFKSSHVRCSLPWSWSSSWQILCDFYWKKHSQTERREMRDERWEMRAAHAPRPRRFKEIQPDVFKRLQLLLNADDDLDVYLDPNKTSAVCKQYHQKKKFSFHRSISSWFDFHFDSAAHFRIHHFNVS